VSPFDPFRHKPFAVLWSATLTANVGVWMYSAAASWLMTTLTVDPMMVALVQVATSLPMFLLAVPAGALADIVDTRRLLIVIEAVVIVLSALFAALVTFDLVTPILLLAFVFMIEAGASMGGPAWQSIVPRLVPREDLAPAVAATSVGFNISRALGPALGGVLSAAFGIAAPFWVNAFSNVGSIGALFWWRPPSKPSGGLPAERVANAVRTGLRYARNNAPLRATLFRAIGFFVFASAYWALLPLVARMQIATGPQVYGLLLGAIGAGAIAGAMGLPWLERRLGTDRLVAAGQAGTAMALVLYGIAQQTGTALVASVLAGTCWIAAVSRLNVSAQVALPEWVRARGLAVHLATMFGSMTLGSMIWGELASVAGLPIAHFVAAGGALLAIPLTWRWKLQQGERLDLTPSMHWPAPLTVEEIGSSEGPVLVSVEYAVAPAHREAFLNALQTLSRQRRRDGAYRWGVFQDAATPERFVETFLVESWLEHLRQHERVTHADRELEDELRRWTDGPPKVTHLVAAK
jgi:predicted MFS family arabinose efflux permease/quinol monooxygenase YgiN